MTEAVDGRRAIAERNAAAILEAAMDVLNADPDAGLAEVAAAAGVGRATLYRHYPNRDALIDALRAHARERVVEVVRAVDLDTGDPVPALERFVTALWQLRDRYSLLKPHDSADAEQLIDEIWLPVRGAIIRAQADGAIDPTLKPSWVVAVLRNMLRAAILEVEAGRVRRADAPDLALRTFLRAVGP